MIEEAEKEEVQTKQRVETRELKKKEEKQAYMPFVPFPHKAKIEEQFSRFLEVFKNIEINFPFAEALIQLPNYVKFLKDILSKKRKFVEEGVVNLTTTCSAVI